jgi:hypothetical protein
MNIVYLGLIGLDYQINSFVDFKIINVPNPSVNFAKFRVSIKNSQFALNSFKFSFFLSTSNLFELGNQIYPINAPTTSISTIFISDSTFNNPSIQIFLNGVTGQTMKTTDQFILSISNPVINGP